MVIVNSLSVKKAVIGKNFGGRVIVSDFWTKYRNDSDTVTL